MGEFMLLESVVGDNFTAQPHMSMPTLRVFSYVFLGVCKVMNSLSFLLSSLPVRNAAIFSKQQCRVMVYGVAN